MLINELSKRVIPFRSHDAKRIGEGSFYIDQIVWLNGDNIEIGEKVGFNFGCYVNGFGGLTIGDRTIIGAYTMIHTANHEMETDRPIPEQGWNLGPVVIGAGCWIGMGVCILPGVTLGDGCVVGAGSVVTRDVEPYSIAVGNPAKVIKSRVAT
jgi:acetyltransferase-like isoleucine patch superfamily enzyme